jgi:hypothetical protein
MMKNINLLSMNDYTNHTLVITSAKIKFLLKLKQLVYQLIVSHVIHVVIRKLYFQYELLTKNTTIVFVYIEVFIIIIDLFCSHFIQKRLYENEFLLIKDQHFH